MVKFRGEVSLKRRDAIVDPVAGFVMKTPI